MRVCASSAPKHGRLVTCAALVAVRAAEGAARVCPQCSRSAMTRARAPARAPLAPPLPLRYAAKVVANLGLLAVSASVPPLLVTGAALPLVSPTRPRASTCAARVAGQCGVMGTSARLRRSLLRQAVISPTACSRMGAHATAAPPPLAPQALRVRARRAAQAAPLGAVVGTAPREGRGPSLRASSAGRWATSGPTAPTPDSSGGGPSSRDLDRPPILRRRQCAGIRRLLSLT